MKINLFFKLNEKYFIFSIKYNKYLQKAMDLCISGESCLYVRLIIIDLSVSYYAKLTNTRFISTN